MSRGATECVGSILGTSIFRKVWNSTAVEFRVRISDCLSMLAPLAWTQPSRAFDCLHFSKEISTQARIKIAKMLLTLAAILTSAFLCTCQADIL